MYIDVCSVIMFHPSMMKPVRSRRVLALAICLGLALGACSSKEGQGIVGKWARGNDAIFTFTKDGRMTKQEGINTDEMEYSIQDGTTLLLKPKDLPMSLRFTISFPSDNEMILTPLPQKGAITQPQSLDPVDLTRVSE
jgi:hypothetical protein